MPELLLGCGNRRVKQLARSDNPLNENGDPIWGDLITLDHDPDCKPDALHDMEDFPYPFSDETFDEIHAYHVLEHMGSQGDWRFFFGQFAELWRIMKPEGLLFAVVPRHDSVWAWGDPSHTRVITQESLIFLDQRNYVGVGNSTMSDFRHYYKVSWEIQQCKIEGEELVFALKAFKPSIGTVISEQPIPAQDSAA